MNIIKQPKSSKFLYLAISLIPISLGVSAISCKKNDKKNDEEKNYVLR